MPKKQRKFADDGWAVWVDGDDTSTVYINDWLNPKGKSYIDIAVRIRGIKSATALHVYIPFEVLPEEIDDVSMKFYDRNILKAIFSTACIVDFKKNEHTTEIAYNGKTIDIVHISTLEQEIKAFSNGTLLTIDFEQLMPYLDNDEAYFIWRMPHKTLDEIFRSYVNVGSAFEKLRDLITTPVLSEKYSYSVRINEARLLPEGITKIGAFHRQKLKKAVIAISLDESYEINDGGCYRIHRLEENLYKEYLPEDYDREDVVTYHWNQNREYNTLGHFNFYYSIAHNSVSRGSMFVYMILLLTVGVLGDFIYDMFKLLYEFLF